MRISTFRPSLALTLALSPALIAGCTAPEDFEDSFDEPDLLLEDDEYDEDELDSDGSDFEGPDALVDADEPVGALPTFPTGFPGPIPIGGEQWVLGDTSVMVEWDSGKTTSLSSWKKVFCNADHGPNFLLTDLRAYREPASNWDKFTARLKGTCTEYENDGDEFVQTANTATDEVFSANHRLPGETTAITNSTEYPAGLQLLNGPGDAYVQQFSILRVSEGAGGFLGDYSNSLITPIVPAMTPLGLMGPVPTVQCPDQHVMSGLRLKYDTRNGKIRRVRIFCRTLSRE